MPERDGGSPTTRAELPRDATSLSPMGEAFSAALEEGIQALGLSDQPGGSLPARLSYELHARLLREWGAAINLTAVREPRAVAVRHICDSLSAAPWLAGLLRSGATLLDLGSGTGYPGLPLAAALPLSRVGLLESVGKKARFLAVAGAAVGGALAGDDGPADDGAADPAGDRDAGMAGDRAAGTAGEQRRSPRIEAIAERAEDLAEDPDERGAWDVVTARAVGSLAEVVELAMPLAREGGHVVAWKREEEAGGLGQELRAAGSIIRATGGGRPEVLVVVAPGLLGHRLVILPKLRPTPAGYPRAAGTRRRRGHPTGRVPRRLA